MPLSSPIKALNDWRFSKNVGIYALVEVNDQLYEQEISLQQPYRNFASIKEGFIECYNFMHIPTNAINITSRRCSPLLRQDDYSNLSIKRFFAIYWQKNAWTTLLKRRTHSVAGFVTVCFDGCFVKCFRHGPSVIFQFQRPVSHLREAFCTRRHNY